MRREQTPANKCPPHGRGRPGIASAGLFFDRFRNLLASHVSGEDGTRVLRLCVSCHGRRWRSAYMCTTRWRQPGDDRHVRRLVGLQMSVSRGGGSMLHSCGGVRALPPHDVPYVYRTSTRCQHAGRTVRLSASCVLCMSIAITSCTCRVYCNNSSPHLIGQFQVEVDFYSICRSTIPTPL